MQQVLRHTLVPTEIGFDWGNVDGWLFRCQEKSVTLPLSLPNKQISSTHMATMAMVRAIPRRCFEGKCG